MRTVHSFSPPFLAAPQDSFLNQHMPAVVVDDADVLAPHDPHSLSPSHNNSSLMNGSPAPSAISPPVLPNPPRTPSPGTQMSIQSLLAASRQPSAEGQHVNWAPSDTPQPPLKLDSAPNGQASSSKRKLDDADADDPHAKIRRTVQKHVTQDQGRLMNMTTVVCLHAAVAQKSYGSEKRFLCPPPLVRIEGPFGHMREQQLSMAIVSENGDKSPEQKAPIDNMMASFKFLHVTGTAKAKSFQLSLEIAHPPVVSPESNEAMRPARMWATFESAPVTIISKPSKKTAKTRNISSCILAGGPVSLFNRINSQTVRTKYMTIDHAHLCASNVSWSAFNVNVLRRPTDTSPVSGPQPQPVTYGCEIVLSDSLSGIATAPLIIRKVDKGKISMEDGGPVSQMQKIALQRLNPDGSRHYLSAAGPLPGTPGVVAPPAPGISSQAGTHHLLFQSPRVREEVKDGNRVLFDEVDDYLCWTIVGISKFQYTFFDALGSNNKIPELPITPFPTLFTAPVYRGPTNTVELTVSNFIYENPKTGQHSALEVWLGDIGPLNQQVLRTSPPGPLTNISSFVHNSSHGQLVGDTPQQLQMDPSTPIMTNDMNGQRFIAPGPVHTIVMVEMPPISDIVKALQTEARLQNGNHAPSHGEKDDEGQNGGSPDGPPISIAGRSLPLLFIRGFDGIGYHSGRTIACDSIFSGIDLHSGSSGGNPPDTAWLAAAQVAASASTDAGLHGWTLRVL